MIEVGEYIRTKDGRIEKVEVINKYGIVHKHDDDNDTFDEGINWYAESGREINEEDIKAHSKNIIDLIEVGDIVNITLWHEPDSFDKFIYDIKDIFEFKQQIKEQIITLNSILTHELYEQNCYKVVE